MINDDDYVILNYCNLALKVIITNKKKFMITFDHFRTFSF